MQASVTVKTGFPLKVGDRLLFKKGGRVEYSYEIGYCEDKTESQSVFIAEVVDRRVKGNKG